MSAITKIRIGIADDHKIFRKGLAVSLRKYDNIDIVIDVNDGEELLAQIPEEDPHIVLCDLKMPNKDGIDTTKTIVQQFPQVRVLVLTMYDDERFVSHLMDTGAAGYLLKNTDEDEIYKAILSVQKTGFYLSSFVNKILLKRHGNAAKFNPSLNSEIQISPKEKNIITYTAMEFTAQEIAEKMDISPRTVESIKKNLMDRFEVKNSIGLVFFAVKNGLID
jgi:DNA-binding NarL/FixJ family response regulator